MKQKIDSYIKNHAYVLEKTKEYFEGISKNEIVYKAALSINSNGKMYRHQCRVGKNKTEIAANKLIQHEMKILNAKTFEDIFKYTEEVRKMKIGVGHLWSYDTALHIGFQLGIYPSKVYMQAGVINGAKIALREKYKYKRYFEVEEFVEELQYLEPFVIENFLCIYGSGKLDKLK